MNETYPNISERRAAFFGHFANRVATTRGGRWRGKPAREPSTCELARESRRAVVPDCLCSSRVTGTCPCIRTVCNCHSPRGAHTRTHTPRVRDISGRSPFFPRVENTGGRGTGKTLPGTDFRAERCPSATWGMCWTLSPPPSEVTLGSRGRCFRIDPRTGRHVCRCDSRRGVPPMHAGESKPRIVAYRLSCGIRERSARKESIALGQWPADHRVQATSFRGFRRFFFPTKAANAAAWVVDSVHIYIYI